MANTGANPWDLALFDRDRLIRGWNYSVIARHISVTPYTVRHFFIGKNRSPKTAQKIANALGYPLVRYVLCAQKRSA